MRKCVKRSAKGHQINGRATRTGFRLLLRLLYHTIFRSKGTAARFTLKRARIMALFLPVFIMLEGIHRVAFLLDEIFFPGYRKVDVKKPVFILGIHRSGTTYLHRLLSKDTDNFSTFNLWELLFAPSIVERKFWYAAGAVDRALGGLGRKLLTAIEDRALKDLRTIHNAGLFEPEEDELVLLPFFATVFLLPPFPFPEWIWALARFDEDLPIEEQDRIMARYKSCLQRHLYVHGPNKCFLSKNPSFSAKIEAINRAFPDAKVVCNVRSPHETIPSFLSLISLYWRTFDNDPQGIKLRDMVMNMVDYLYRHPIERLPSWPNNRHAFVKYEDLTADPERIVLELYERMGFSLSPGFRAYLKLQRGKMRDFKSQHKYSLDQWQLTPEHILAEYGDVFEYFGFNPE